MAIVRPQDLPTAAEVREDPALVAITRWKEPQQDEPPHDTRANLEFAQKIAPGFMEKARKAIALLK